MSFLDNLRLSKEDDEVLAEGGSEPSGIDVTEAIQAEEDALEVAETEQAIESEQAEIETQAEVAEELQDQSDTIEEQLESPEEVTPEDVAVAQEAFAFTLGRLAKNSEVYKSYKITKISSEDARKDPVTSLKLHQEGIKDVLKSVWESLKTMFKKIVAWCSKIYQKVIAMFTNFEKKAKALKDKVENTKTFEESKAKDLLVKHVPFAGYFGEAKVGTLPAGIAAVVKTATESVNIINKIANETLSASGSLDSGNIIFSCDNIKEAEAVFDQLMNDRVAPFVALALKGGTNKGESVMGQILNENFKAIFGGEATESLSFNKKGGFTYKAELKGGAGVYFVIPFYADSQGIHFVCATALAAGSLGGSVDSDGSSKDSVSAGMAWNFKHGVLKYSDKFSVSGVTLPKNGADIHYILDSVINYGKVKNDIIKGSENISKATTKLIDALGKIQSAMEDVYGKNKKVANLSKSIMNYAKFGVSNLTTMVIKQYIYVGKSYLSYAAALIGEKSEGKDSK